MSTVPVDNAYMKLVERFPLVPLREESHFEEAIKVMKELAYHRTSLSRGQADYLSVLAGLIAEYEKRLPRLADKMTPQEALLYLMQVNGPAIFLRRQAGNAELQYLAAIYRTEQAPLHLLETS